MAKESQPFSISSAKVLNLKVERGILLRERQNTLTRFQTNDDPSAGGFDLQITPVGVVVKDLKKKGPMHLVPWSNVDDVELEDA